MGGCAYSSRWEAEGQAEGWRGNEGGVHLSASDPGAQGGVQRPGARVQVLTLPFDPGDPEGLSEEGAGTSGGASG